MTFWIIPALMALFVGIPLTGLAALESRRKLRPTLTLEQLLATLEGPYCR